MNPGRQSSRRSAAVAAAILCLSFAGCAGLCRQVTWLPFCPPECRLSAEATTEEIVAHLNANTERLRGWRATSASIRTWSDGVPPISLTADLAIERPRNFRLRASLLGSNEVDFGSNAERFWFWIRRSNQPHVVTVEHESLPRVQHRLALPFEPEWLMEALGVVPLDAAKLSVVNRRPEQRRLHLLGVRQSPRGQTVRRLIAIDTCLGVIVEQSLRDAEGRLIARALLSNHRRDPDTGLVLPRKLELEWPEAGVSLVIRLQDVEFNPPEFPRQSWELPTNLGAGARDLLTGRPVRQAGGVGRPPSGVR